MKNMTMRGRVSLYRFFPLLLSWLRMTQRRWRVATMLPTLLLAGVMVFSATLHAVVPVPENFVLIRGGEFTMGSPESEFHHEGNEAQHQVRLSSFYMSKYAVTVSEFKSFVEATGYQTDIEKGGYSQNWRHGVSGSVRPESEANHPVICVSWNDAVAYCEWMSKKSGKTYRLPTEAEREYACRAGTTTPFNTGKNLTTEQANYHGYYPYANNPQGVNRRNTVPVNSFSPNAWGLYNMHGNVFEWCSDWFGDRYYDDCKASGTVSNPVGPATGSLRVLRGGVWGSYAMLCRSAYRGRGNPGRGQHDDVGFRLVFVP